MLAWSTGACAVGPWLVALSCLVAVGCSRDQAPDQQVLIDRADGLIQSGQRIEAAELLEKALRANPRSAALRWRLGRLEFELGELEPAESYLLGALDLGTSPSSVLPFLAKVLLAKEDFKQLFQLDLPASLSSSARAAVLMYQAMAYAELDRDDHAELLALEALRLAPENREVLTSRARLLRRRGRIEEAETILRKVIAEDPSNVDALGALADLTRDQGRLREAEGLYGQALAHAAMTVPLNFLRAEVRLDLGLVDLAEEDAAVVGEALPDTFGDHYLRGRVLLARGQPAEALARLEAASAIQPMHLGTLLFGGQAAYLVGRYNQAEDWLLRLWSSTPENARARLILGTIRFQQGRYADAERFLRPLPEALPKSIMARRVLAAALIAQDKAAEAVQVLRDLVTLQADAPRSELDLSIALLLSGAEESGLAVLQGLLAEHPDYRPAYEYLVAYHVRQESWDQAGQWADAYVGRYPDDARALFFRGEMLLQAGRSEPAVEAFEAAVQAQPGYPDANLRLAELALSADDTQTARARYAAILEHEPASLPALIGEARLLLGAQHPDDAAGVLQQAVAAHPQALAPRLDLGRLLLDQEKAQQAVAALQDAAPQTFSKNADYLYLLAEALRATGAPQLAADRLRELLALAPSSQRAYRLYAEVLTELDDKIALESTLNQMLTLDPGDIQARLELVRLHIATDRFPTAERLLTPMLADPGRPPLVDLLHGWILSATDRPRQAVISLRRAYALAPSERTLLALANAEADADLLTDAIALQEAWLAEHADAAEVHVNLAGHLARAGRVDGAIARYRQALEQEPQHVVALNNLAWYLMDEDVEQALGYAIRALEIQPASAEIAHTVVTAQVQAQRWRDAELTLDRALARYPTNADLLWLSARVQYQKGRRERALSDLDRVLEADLPEDERKQAKGLQIRIEDELRAEADAKLW